MTLEVRNPVARLTDAVAQDHAMRISEAVQVEWRARQCEHLLDLAVEAEARAKGRKRSAVHACAFGALLTAAVVTTALLGRGSANPSWAGGTWLHAGDTPTALQLSPGAELELGRGARARLLEVGERHAWIALESGRASATFDPPSAVDWKWDAGPYVVRGRHAELSLSWEPEGRRFELQIFRGQVTVQGPEVGAARTLASGERLVLGPSSAF